MSATLCPAPEVVATSDPIAPLSPDGSPIPQPPPDNLSTIIGPGVALPDPLSPVAMTGTPPCLQVIIKRGVITGCPHRAIPGSALCGAHGGKVTLRADGTLGYIGPGTYHAIGKMIGVSHRTVSNILRGEVGASITMLTKIAKAVGIGREELLQYIERQMK